MAGFDPTDHPELVHRELPIEGCTFSASQAAVNSPFIFVSNELRRTAGNNANDTSAEIPSSSREAGALACVFALPCLFMSVGGMSLEVMGP